MNDFSEIESELKELRPALVRPELAIRIENAFREEIPPPPTGMLSHQRSSQANWISLGLGVGLAAAAAFLMLARVRDGAAPVRTETNFTAVNPTPNERSASSRTGRMVPAGLTEVVYHTRDEGLHFPEGATEPVRRVRYQTRETLHWQNPETGASLRVSYPSEEVVLLPVSGQ